MSVNLFKNGLLQKIAGAVGDAVPLINNFLTNQEGKGAADANTVYVLKNEIDGLNESLTNLSNKKVVITANPIVGDIIPFPNGFNMNNCTLGNVIGFYSTNSTWYNGYDANGQYSAFFQLGLSSDGIKCEVRYASDAFTNFRITLERMD